MNGCAALRGHALDFDCCEADLETRLLWVLDHSIVLSVSSGWGSAAARLILVQKTCSARKPRRMTYDTLMNLDQNDYCHILRILNAFSATLEPVDYQGNFRVVNDNSALCEMTKVHL